MSDLADGAVLIIRCRFDDDRNAGGTIDLIASFDERLCALAARAASNGALDIIGGHGVLPGLLDGKTQARIAIRVAAAGARRDLDLPNKAREQPATVPIRDGLFPLNLRPFGVSAHGWCAFMGRRTPKGGWGNPVGGFPLLDGEFLIALLGWIIVTIIVTNVIMEKIQIERTRKTAVLIHSKKGDTVGRLRVKLGKPDRMLRWAATLTPMGVIEKSKQGIRGRDLEEIQKETNFSNEDWSRYLQVAWRTIQRYRKQNAVIDSASSERALLVAQIVEDGRSVFGNDTAFRAWLSLPSRALGGRSPNELLDTTTGMHVVKSELLRIEHGVY
jgi:putative toxin-antitoxin system antitoxin component (TIGR02293 family)